MKTKTITRTAALLLLAIFTDIGCSDDSSDVGAVVDNFIPIISNAWKDINSDYIYILSADSSDVPRGTFTGTRQDVNNAGNVADLNGSFVHEKIQFTFINGTPVGITYKGVIDTLHPDNMRLANTADPQHDSLHLVRQ